MKKLIVMLAVVMLLSVNVAPAETIDNLSIYDYYKLESGTLTVTGNVDISSNGIFEQTGGNLITDSLFFGNWFSGGHYVLSGGTVNITNNFQGMNDSSTFEHTGGTITIAQMWGVGSYNLSQTNDNNPSTLTSLGTTRVNGGQTFTQSGGVHNSYGLGVFGQYTLSGGTQTVDGELYIMGDGMYRMTGGSFTAGHVTVGTDYSPNGTLEVASGSTVSVRRDETNPMYHHNTLRTFGNGSVDLTQGGKVLVGNANTGQTGSITIGTNGALEGTGTIIGNVSNQGIVRSSWPSDAFYSAFNRSAYSPGTLTITGDYEQDSAGTLALFMSGSDADSFSQLSIGGQANIAGELSLSLINGFIPDIGDIFEILNAGSCYGTFSSFNVIGLPDDMYFDIEYGSNYVALEVVPEPATLLLFGLGGLALRRKRRAK